MKGEVLILAEGELHHALIRLDDLDGVQVVRQNSPNFPETSLPTVVVLVAPSCNAEFCQRAIAEIKGRLLSNSTIVVTRADLANAYALGSMWRGAVAWLGDHERALVKLVRGILERDFRRHAYDLFASCLDSSEPLARAAEVAFLHHPPPTNHRELSSAAHLPEIELRREWRARGLPERSEALVDWGLLVAVADARARGLSLEQASRRLLRVDPRRVQRAAYRRTGEAAGRLGKRTLIDALRRWLSDSSGASAI